MNRSKVARAFIAGAALIGTIGAFAGPASAAPPARYQLQEIRITTAIGSGHDYTGWLSPCDGSFIAEGTTVGYNENVTGVLTASTLTFESIYEGPVNDGLGIWDPYSFTVDATRAGGAWTGTYLVSKNGSPTSETGALTGTVTLGGMTSYKNHGEFVAASGGGSDAAHSCIGMPIKKS